MDSWMRKGFSKPLSCTTTAAESVAGGKSYKLQTQFWKEYGSFRKDSED